MGNAGTSAVRIIDSDNEVVTVTDGRLDVNAELIIGDVNVGNIDVLSVIPGTGATNLGKAEDASHTSGDVGVMSLAVRQDSLLAFGGDGDYAPLQVNGSGALYVVQSGDISLAADTGANEAFNIASAQASSSQRGIVPLIKMNDAVSAPTAHIDNDWTYFQTNIKGALYTTGGEVEDAAVQSQPLLIGGRYDSSARTLDDGDAGAVALNASGHMLVGGTVDLGSTDNGVLDAIAASLALLDNSIASGNELQVDVVAALPAGTNAIGKVGHDMTGMVSGNDLDIGTSGAAIMGSTACKRVDIMAHPDNTGYIWIGGSNIAVNRGVRLAPGDFYSVDIDNVADIYAIATVDQEDIVFTYYT